MNKAGFTNPEISCCDLGKWVISCQCLKGEHEEEFHGGGRLMAQKDVKIGRYESAEKFDTILGNLRIVARFY
jgi:hypothetical protein